MTNRLELRTTERIPFADGHVFDDVGAYERLSGRAHFAVDPHAAAQAGIVDLDLAPRDDNGLVLTLMRTSRTAEVTYPETFHIGFIQESEERVNEINHRLKEDGYAVPPPARLHGSWTFYFTAPGGFTIEVLA